MQLANRLYGVTVKPSAEKLPKWHPDVELYEVFDGNSTTPMAYFYADLYARPGSKQGGAWVQPLADRAHYQRDASPAARAAADIRSRGGDPKKLYSAQLAKQQADWLAAAPLHLPVAVLVSNQNPPAGGKPSLMTLDDAETLFHEFGHALQAMLTTVKEPLAAGIRWVDGWVPSAGQGNVRRTTGRISHDAARCAGMAPGAVCSLAGGRFALSS